MTSIELRDLCVADSERCGWNRTNSAFLSRQEANGQKPADRE